MTTKIQSDELLRQKNAPGTTVAYLILRRRVNRKIRAELEETDDE